MVARLGSPPRMLRQSVGERAAFLGVDVFLCPSCFSVPDHAALGFTIATESATSRVRLCPLTGGS
jgi:hypothetical protein